MPTPDSMLNSFIALFPLTCHSATTEQEDSLARHTGQWSTFLHIILRLGHESRGLPESHNVVLALITAWNQE